MKLGQSGWRIADPRFLLFDFSFFFPILILFRFRFLFLFLFTFWKRGPQYNVGPVPGPGPEGAGPEPPGLLPLKFSNPKRGGSGEVHIFVVKIVLGVHFRIGRRVRSSPEESGSRSQNVQLLPYIPRPEASPEDFKSESGRVRKSTEEAV